MSEINRPRTFLFDMMHHLSDLYQVYSNYAHRAKDGPNVLHKHEKTNLRIDFRDEILSETNRPRTLLFGMMHHLSDIQIMLIGPKMAPTFYINMKKQTFLSKTT